MAEQLFLIAPDNADSAGLATKLEAALSAAPVSVLLLPVGDRSETEYADFVQAVAPFAQAKGVAVLLENRPDLVRHLGADGVHMTSGIKALREAIALVKPDFIVGTGDIGSRHEAMLRGELDIDYLLFGDRDESDAEMADWWAETFEVPSVYLAGSPDDPAVTTVRTEFVGFGGAIWDEPTKLVSMAGVPA
ncbi:thiamine phosphate synthase [Pelagibacterium limicola]|uniref:thiamine phosphate synthase n=1 Tax=Pelagibacterium limicola TaxID=2791022 RepID=UPI0018B00DB1|nr:thiamine phosphate synthase [Pelagibacterium limicola]